MKHLNNFLREPLLHFLLIGGGLFLFYELTEQPTPDAPSRIVVNDANVEQLQAQFKRTWIREPRPQELDGLITAYIRDEVYYREALAMGLDRNDPQVRQRMRMKMEFLLEDLTAEKPPSDEALDAFLQQHPDNFFIEPQVSFQQVFIDPEKRPDFDAQAKNVLNRLLAGAAEDTVGDASMLPTALSGASQDHIKRAFGESFASDVVALEPGDWTGPVYSNLGVHLVKVSQRQLGYLPLLADVREQVERDYLVQRRQLLKDQAYEKLRVNYEVVINADIATDIPVATIMAGEAIAATRSVEVAR